MPSVLPKHGDRTVDQMVQTARSGKQNFVEGFADGVTSTEMEVKLPNVARTSLKELQEDYVGYLAAHKLQLLDKMMVTHLGKRSRPSRKTAASASA